MTWWEVRAPSLRPEKIDFERTEQSEKAQSITDSVRADSGVLVGSRMQ